MFFIDMSDVERIVYHTYFISIISETVKIVGIHSILVFGWSYVSTNEKG